MVSLVLIGIEVGELNHRRRERRALADVPIDRHRVPGASVSPGQRLLSGPKHTPLSGRRIAGDADKSSRLGYCRGHHGAGIC